MNKTQINIPVALLHIGSDLYRIRTLYPSEIDGLIDSRQNLGDRLKKYVQNALLNWKPDPFSSTTCMIPQEIYSRQRPLAFESGSIDCLLPLNASRRYRLASVKGTVGGKEEEILRNEPLFPIPIHFLYDQTDFSGMILVWIPVLNDILWLKSKPQNAGPPSEQGLTADLLLELDSKIVKLIQIQTQGNPAELLFECSQIIDIEYLPQRLTIETPESQETTAKAIDNQRNQTTLLNKAALGLRPVTKQRRAIVESQSGVDQMIDALFQSRPESVLLVGAAGSGKSALWSRFVQVAKQIQPDFRFYEIDPVSLIAHGENENDWYPAKKLDQLVQLAQKENLVVHVGNLWELDQMGRGAQLTQSLADLIAPFLLRGQIRVVAECQPDQLSELENLRPQILVPYFLLTMKPKSSETIQAIFRTFIAAKTGKVSDRVIAPEALVKLENLFRRYCFYSEQPGAGITFLDQLLVELDVRHSRKDANDENSSDAAKKTGARGTRKMGPAQASDVVRLFGDQTGLPLFMLDESVPFDRKKTERFFNDRVIGQNGQSRSDGQKTAERGAIQEVVDLLETIKAGLSRTNGPIATLLFIGPTGVGKSELAKALAEYLYNDPRRMIRIDMSEYADALGADRLINGTADGEGVLTGQVRMQPFGVVLFDEFEKANPAVFDYLLQILGEGRLTDAKGRLANFQSNVIILTSNLGVESFGQINIGLRQESAIETAGDHFRSELQKFVRPELLNRIDRIVPFAPLNEQTLLAILDKELREAAQRPGFRNHGTALEIDSEAKRQLIRLSYQPQYGARPLKRALDQLILVPLADAFSQYQYDTPLKCRVTWASPPNESGTPFEFQVYEVNPDSEAEESESVKSQKLAVFSQVRRRIQALQNSSWIRQARSETILWEKAYQEELGKKALNAERQEIPDRSASSLKETAVPKQNRNKRTYALEQIRKEEKQVRQRQVLLNRVDNCCKEIERRERDALYNWLTNNPQPLEDPEPWQNKVNNLVLNFYNLLSSSTQNTIWIFLLCDVPPIVQFYADLYARIASKESGIVREWDIVHLRERTWPASDVSGCLKEKFFENCSVGKIGSRTGQVGRFQSLVHDNLLRDGSFNATNDWIVGAPCVNGSYSESVAQLIDTERNVFGKILEISNCPKSILFEQENGVHRIGVADSYYKLAVAAQKTPDIASEPEKLSERILASERECRSWKFTDWSFLYKNSPDSCQINENRLSARRTSACDLESLANELEELLNLGLVGLLDRWLQQ